MTPSELDHHFRRFRDHYMRRKAIAACSMLVLEFLAIIRDFEREDWE